MNYVNWISMEKYFTVWNYNVNGQGTNALKNMKKIVMYRWYEFVAKSKRERIVFVCKRRSELEFDY